MSVCVEYTLLFIICYFVFRFTSLHSLQAWHESLGNQIWGSQVGSRANWAMSTKLSLPSFASLANPASKPRLGASFSMSPSPPPRYTMKLSPRTG